MAQSAADLPDGYRLIVLEEVGSTNVEALRQGQAGEPGGLWIVARRQVAGKGRQGRSWTSDAGNLYASLLLRDPLPAERLPGLPLAVAVAVHEAISDVLPPPLRADLAIKWPNDILLRGAKLCGILIEGASGPAGRLVVIGTGINCAHHPADLGTAATDLAAAGYPTDPMVLHGRLARRLDQRIAVLRERPFEETRMAWLDRAAGLGSPIRVRLPGRELSGRFEALDAEGRLVLRLDDGRRETVSAGDVFFPPNG